MRLSLRTPDHRANGDLHQRSRRARFWISFLLITANLALLVGLGVHYTARAAAVAVTSLADSGPGTLRELIANASPGDTITFNVTGQVALASELVIDKDLTISGPGTTQLSVSTGRASRIITNNAKLTISGITLRDGEAGADLGGGILNGSTGVLNISDVMFTLNRAHMGGAIYNSAGGTVTVANSTFYGNLTSLATDGNGGGVYNAAGGTLRVSSSLFISNQIHDNGSGIYNDAVASVENSTFAFNQAGTAAVANTGDLVLNNVTITGNNGRKHANGLYVISGSATVQNSIISGNSIAGNGSVSECFGTVTSAGHNILGYLGKCDWSAGEGDLIGTEVAPIFPGLGALSDNGGPTYSMVPVAGSPAIDAGSPAVAGTPGACATTDQRGLLRPAIGPSGSAICDIGATEVGASAVVQPAPEVQATVNGPVLLGQATTFSATGLDTSFAYHWDFGDGSAADGVQVSHTYMSAGIYTAHVTADNTKMILSAAVVATINNPVPVLSALSQSTVVVHQPITSLVVSGSNFAPDALVYVQDAPRATSVVTFGQLAIVLTDADLATPGSLQITVVNPAPGGGASSALTLNVTDVPPPPPAVTASITTIEPASGKVGDTVTLTGVNLTGATSVSFNGTAASSFTVVSDTSVTAVVPQGATTGPITVATPAGTASSAAFTLADAPPPPPATPSVSGIAPVSALVGEIITITGANLTGTTSVSFNGTAASSFTIVSDTSVTAIIPKGATSGPIAISTLAGTASSASLTVLPPPVPTISAIAPASGKVGETVTLTGANLTGATNVSFNGSAATSFAVVNDTTITAVVPQGATSGAVSITTAYGSASSSAFSVLVLQACTVNVQVPALAGGQTFWLQLTTRAAGPISASWTLPVAQSSQLLLYTGNPFAGLSNPVSRGPTGKPIAAQNTSNTSAFSITSGSASATGVYTIQFFNSGKSFAGSLGTISYYSDATACATSVSGSIIP